VSPFSFPSGLWITTRRIETTWHSFSMALATCNKCGKTFSVKPFFIKTGAGKYCSAACQHEARRTGTWLKCEGCKKDIYRTPKYLKASKSKKYFCGKSCQTIWRNKEYSGARHAHWKHGMASYRNILKRAKINPQCSLCTINDERILVVHHKDKNRVNNKISNLVWLCRNCHYLTHNYDIGRIKGFIV
jgi:hypothetical protein